MASIRPHHKRKKGVDHSVIRDGLSKVLVNVRPRIQVQDYPGAEQLYNRYVAQDATVASAWYDFGSALKRQSDLVGAANAFITSLCIDSKQPASHIGLAEVLLFKGNLHQALEHCNIGIRLSRRVGEGHIIRAYIQKNLGDLSKAAEDLRLVINCHPSSSVLYITLSDIYERMDRPDQSIAVLQKAIHVSPLDFGLKTRLAQALACAGRIEDGLKVLTDAKGDDGRNIERGLALAAFYMDQGMGRNAFEIFSNVIQINPDCVDAYMGLSKIASQEYDFALAVSINSFITQIRPDCAVAHYNLGIALTADKRLEDAIEAFRRSIAKDATFNPAIVELGWAKARICDWEDLKKVQHSSVERRLPIQPFIMMTYSIPTIERQLQNADAWSTRFGGASTTKRLFASACSHRTRTPKSRIRVGYISSDFYNHATVALMIGLLEHHDRSLFEIKAYSFGPNDHSQLRQRLIAAVESFVDVRTLSDNAIASLIRNDNIDILVDLKGYTLDSRTSIFSARAAPIQVNYLGYPGTMGGDLFDYVIADPVVAPMEHAHFYAEKIVHLPHTYQPNDRLRFRASQSTRAECGLPEGAFIFCCFNNNYKITEEMFSVWMRLLTRVEDSVLWLLESSSAVKRNLCHEAQKYGVDPQRLIFAPYVPVVQHLARIGAADLFLDTLPYNAHTTASEALWMGLPVLTCIGDLFAGRVAASLVQAIGLPELITTSMAAYEQQAFYLACNPIQLAGIRQRLDENRLTHPLFDIERYTRNYEKALHGMIERHNTGRSPESFAVVE